MKIGIALLTLQSQSSYILNHFKPLIMNTEDQIIEALKQSEKPMSAGQIADKTGLDRKVVDKAMSKLKTEEKIVSPVRCFWTAK
jgi:predicted ArsR family transcriptional regulator